ncbi:hypothetical protein, partial [Hyphomonas sp.]|uniref:hypothetical protein n=1 Tax=Hyphomonas sp. TaxID=87 RepID=UPI00391B8AF2
AKAAAIEARAADMEKRMAKHTIKIDARAEAEVEKKMAVIERRIEANSDRIEKIVEERFGPEFEARIQAQAKVIEDLVEDCRKKPIADGETAVIERKDVDGDTVRLACVKGDRAALKSEKALAYVGNYPGITEAEKAKFRAAAKGHRGKQVFVVRSGDADIDMDYDFDFDMDLPKAPKPQKAPKTPETSELEGE